MGCARVSCFHNETTIRALLFASVLLTISCSSSSGASDATADTSQRIDGVAAEEVLWSDLLEDISSPDGQIQMDASDSSGPSEDAGDTLVPGDTADAADSCDLPDEQGDDGGPEETVCQPDCLDKVCGEDGCGGNCGDCLEDEVCIDYLSCVPANALLVWKSIPGGQFQMGCSPGDTVCPGIDNPTHGVTLSAFFMLETEVTEAQYEYVAKANPSAHYGGAAGPNFPVENVTWTAAQAFCEAVSASLCSEAQWEYAARAGTTTKFGCGDAPECLDLIAWHNNVAGAMKHEVKGKAANDFGLYDMFGNVWEWTADWYGETYYAISPDTDPLGPDSGTYRVRRGGGFFSNMGFMPSSLRSYENPTSDFLDLGFRCCK